MILNNAERQTGLTEIARPRGGGRAVGVARREAVCVVLPAYNEARVIARTFDAMTALARLDERFHFTVVDDGSRDGTPEVLEQLIRRRGGRRVELIALPDNRGKGKAIRTGVLAARGDYVIFLDADLAYGLEHLPVMVEALARYDVVIGSRSLAHDHGHISLTRRVLGRGYNLLSRAALNLSYPDMQAGIKGFRREAARRIFRLQRLDGFSFDAELIFLARKLSMRIGQVPARVADEHSDKASKVRLVRDSAAMLADLLRIRANSMMGRYG